MLLESLTVFIHIHLLLSRFVKYGIGPFLVLVSLHNGILYTGLSLLVFGRITALENHLQCLGCFDVFNANFLLSFNLLRASVSRFAVERAEW